MRSASSLNPQNPRREDLSVRRSSGAAVGLLPLLRLVGGAASLLSIGIAALCVVVFCVSALVGGGASHVLSAGDPILVLPQGPALKSARNGTSAEMAALLRREAQTADAVIAAYRRSQVAAAAMAQPPAASETVASLAPETQKSGVADVSAPVERPFPVPTARPFFEPRRAPAIAQAKPSSPPFDKGAAATPETNQLAYLPEQAATGNPIDNLFSKRSAPSAIPGRGRRVAVYDISAGVVYMPDGEKLEAHSGVGNMRDNPRYANVRMLGPTPPATYALTLREAPFHGVDAIRLTPISGAATFGRDGFLAHTYMLRRRGDSNGCVVFADYDRFLRAFKRNEVNVMVVVPRLQERLSVIDGDFAQG